MAKPDSTIDLVKMRKERVAQVLRWANGQLLSPRFPILARTGGLEGTVMERWILGPVRLALVADGSPFLVNTTWAAVEKNMKIDFGMLYDRLNVTQWTAAMNLMRGTLYDVMDSTVAHPDGGFLWNPKTTAVQLRASTEGSTTPTDLECYRALGLCGGTHPDISHPPPTPPAPPEPDNTESGGDTESDDEDGS